MPFVYLLRCGDGSLYAGAAKDLARRLAEHLAGTASRYTRTRLPVELVWSQQVESWGDALREEFRLKQLSRAEKDDLLRAGAAPSSAASSAASAAPSAAAGAAPNSAAGAAPDSAAAAASDEPPP